MTDNYQVNTVDICPVGALTSKDFRFEQRVWFLDETETVCGGCSKGCNVFVHHKSGKHIYRLKPRYNKEVNSHWMCDRGRDTYKRSNYDSRTSFAKLGGVELPMNEALQIWASDLKPLIAMEQSSEIGIWLSPQLTNEELSSVHALFSEKFGVKKYFSENVAEISKNDKDADGLLLRTDDYPNSSGFLKFVEEKKISLGTTEQLVEQVKKQGVQHLVIFAPENDRAVDVLSPIQSALTSAQFSVIVSSQAKVVDLFSESLSIPSISHLEKNGTIQNHAGIQQKLTSKFRMFRETLSTEEVMTGLLAEYQRPQDQEFRKEASR